MPQLKILHLITTMDYGGAELRLWDEVSHSDPKRYSITLAYILGNAELLKNRTLPSYIKIEDLTWRGGFSFFSIFRLFFLLARNKFDLIHTHLIHASILGRLMGTLFRIPIITTQHHAYQFKDATWIYRFERLTRRLSSHFIAISNYTKYYLLRSSFGQLLNITVIPTGINMEHLMEVSSSRLHLLTAFETKFKKNLNNNAITIIGTVANFRPQKNYDCFFEATQEIIAYCPDVLVITIGGGKDLIKYQKKIKKYDISDHLIFMGATPNAYQWIQLFDIFILSSEQEAFGRVLLEAMLFKKAIVATHVEAIPEIVVSKRTGLLVPQNNAHDLAQAIIALMKNKPLRNSLGQLGHQRLKEMFTVGRMIQKIDMHYNNMRAKAL